MKTITFVTTNDIKFEVAKHAIAGHDINLKRQQMEFEEIQAKEGEPIVRHKAQQAFATLKMPIVVTDDSWSIPGLRGFPGPYMKDVNEWLTGTDFLHLTKHLTDRQILLQQHAIYQDEHGQQYFVATITGELLHEVRGSSKSSILEITSFDGSQQSYAETTVNGKAPTVGKNVSVWQQVADWLEKH